MTDPRQNTNGRGPAGEKPVRIRCISPRRPWAEGRAWEIDEEGDVAAADVPDLIKSRMFGKV